MKRRKLFERSALVVAAGAATGASLPGAATAAPGRTSTRIGTVVAAHGAARVEVAFADGSPTVTVATDGFPDGWQLREGDRVVVTDVVTGELVAAPLVTRVTGTVRDETGAGPDVVRVADTAVTVRPATVRAGSGPDTAAADHEAYFIENTRGLRPDCVALRPSNTAS